MLCVSGLSIVDSQNHTQQKAIAQSWLEAKYTEQIITLQYTNDKSDSTMPNYTWTVAVDCTLSLRKAGENIRLSVCLLVLHSLVALAVPALNVTHIKECQRMECIP